MVEVVAEYILVLCYTHKWKIYFNNDENFCGQCIKRNAKKTFVDRWIYGANKMTERF